MKKATILYIDREPNNIASMTAIFRKDYHVLSASTGSKGFEILMNHVVHIVICDHYVRDMYGTEFLLRAAGQFHNCTYLLISDHPYADGDAPKSHIFKKLTKPWDEAELKIVLDEAYERFLLKEKMMS